MFDKISHEELIMPGLFAVLNNFTKGVRKWFDYILLCGWTKNKNHRKYDLNEKINEYSIIYNKYTNKERGISMPFLASTTKF